MPQIHSTAIIDSSANLAEDVVVGPYAIIGANVQIGSGSIVKSHANIEGKMTIGENNEIHPFASIGCAPPDRHYQGEDTEVMIGDENIIREYVTIHRGTLKEKGVTQIGNKNWLMPYTHVAHDCSIGDSNVLTNQVALSGHVQIGDFNTFGGGVGVVQFCHLGDHVFVPGMVKVGMNVPSFITMSAKGGVATINKIGLRRYNVPDQSIKLLHKSFILLYKKGLKLEEAKIAIQEMGGGDIYVQRFLDSIEKFGSKRLLR